MTRPDDAPPIAIWAGLECTVNRVGGRYFDQIERTGHAAREGDIDRLAALGVRTLRYPVLWERVAPDGLDRADFRWTDERLGRLRALGLTPIVGLVHHGSGPRATGLLDPDFPVALARYARLVAARYPWVTDFTPVNEPLTTARFSALYGHWYPHRRDPRAFVRALLHQCRGVVLAMAAIRAVTPRARLVLTEDYGRTSSTPRLAYQAEHENLRRRLSMDLLTGRVDRAHPLRRYLVEHGASEGELDALLDAPPPDLLGLNYYVTSDRHLDERIERYPAWSHGGNGRERYADVEAARAHVPGILGHELVLREVWERYGLPVALTEVHLGGTRDEQLRWWMEAWSGAHRARDAGADVRAVTAWSAFGAYDWDRLVVDDAGRYETGLFDARSDPPRPTALAATLRALHDGQGGAHPVADAPGWWRRPSRLGGADSAEASSARPLLIAGAGTLARVLERVCKERGVAHRLLTRREMDIADASSVARALAAHAPWAIVNAAGYVRVDDAERDAARCHRENAVGPAHLARACAERGVRLVVFSSDLVFDGAARRPYVEPDPVAPLSTYGESKARVEALVLAALPAALVIRTSSFFGPLDAENFVTVALTHVACGRPFRAAVDVTISPTYVPDLVHACLDLLIDGERGLWHLANRGEVTWAGLARQAASQAGLDATRVVGVPRDELGWTATRPGYSVLGTGRGLALPAIDDAIARYLACRDRGVAIVTADGERLSAAF